MSIRNPHHDVETEKEQQNSSQLVKHRQTSSNIVTARQTSSHLTTDRQLSSHSSTTTPPPDNCIEGTFSKNMNLVLYYLYMFVI